ncbi:TBC1 domain family member 2A isoform X2 [Myripristis murdjan]|nr:TBC1 domain family member 2A isoform X2 [Myripristis murdjan]
MEGGSPGGNPSAASSRSFPAQAEAEDGADWISAPAASEETAPDTNNVGRPTHDYRCRRGEATSSTSDSREERAQSPSGFKTEDSQEEPLSKDDQAAEEPKTPAQTEHQTHRGPPAADQQNPEASSPAEDPTASTSDKHQNQQERTHCLSSSQAQEPPTESLTKENQTTDVPAQPSTTDHQSHQDPPPTDHQSQKDPPPPDHQSQKDHLSEDQQTQKNSQQQNKNIPPSTEQQKQVSLSTDQKTHKVPPNPKDQQIKKDPVPKSPKTQKDLHSTVQQNQKDLLSKDLRTQKDLPSTVRQNQKDLLSKDLKTQKDLPSKDLRIQKDLPSTVQQNQKDPSLTKQQKQKVPPSTSHQPRQDPPPAHPQTPELRAPLSSPANLGPAEPSALAPPVTIEAFCDQVQPQPQTPSSSSGVPKLCGYLQKQGGPLKAWKQRWFTYEEKKSQLFYYRTPQDVTPLGRVELGSATFTYPLKAENGTFHIQTPERTFILKAVSQQVMLYWLQQLQLKRWQHRVQQSAGSPGCSDSTNNNNNSNAPDDFLPMLTSPLGLVGEDAAGLQTQMALFPNVSLKHPLIEIQNSVHSLRKRSSQDWSQSVFHVEIPPSPAASEPSTPRTPVEPPTPTSPASPADPAGRRSPADPAGRRSPSLFESQRSRRKKSRSSSTLPVIRRDTSSSDRMSRLQQEKHMLAEEVKAQKELVWLLHKALEAAQLEKRTCGEFLAAKGEQERLELLRHRERQAADLRSRLEEVKTEAEALRRSLAQRDAQLSELQENLRMMMEKNQAKQEVIVKLSDQVTACMSDPLHSLSSPSNGLDSQTFKQLQQEIENLKDDIEAYKTQNKFLNSEIYQLTKLWRKSSEQEKSLMVKCAYLEASNCQVESRYLGVLRKLQESKALEAGEREAVKKLIEDALRGELKSVAKLTPHRDHDEYGFKIIPDYEVEDMKLLAKIQALEIRSHNLLHQEAGDRPLLGRWAQYLAGRSGDDLCASPELKSLIRAGVPQEYRQQVWRWVVRARTHSIKDHHPQRYTQLCEKSRTSPHPASRQIQLDLHRTLTTNQRFSSPSSPALQQLRRILLAFSWHNPAIGYCQGLNRLAAIALLVLQSEEDAFWCLVTVVEAIMPLDYYTKNLVASQADQRVLKEFMAEKLPRLAAHFEEHSIDVSLITFNWFLVVFVESLPSNILLRLWDAFLYEGTKVIFRYALALFKYKEEDILKIHDSVEIYQYLRFFTKTVSDGRKLTSIAFNDMNPFPGRLLRNRRAVHLERLQGELRELEEQQKEFVTESAERKDKELDTMVSEDDEEL